MITEADIQQLFHLPSAVAASRLGICPSSLKKLCRKFGIHRWPYRKVKSLAQSQAVPIEQARDLICTSPSQGSHTPQPISLSSSNPSSIREASLPTTTLSPLHGDGVALSDLDFEIPALLRSGYAQRPASPSPESRWKYQTQNVQASLCLCESTQAPHRVVECRNYVESRCVVPWEASEGAEDYWQNSWLTNVHREGLIRLYPSSAASHASALDDYVGYPCTNPFGCCT